MKKRNTSAMNGKHFSSTFKPIHHSTHEAAHHGEHHASPMPKGSKHGHDAHENEYTIDDRHASGGYAKGHMAHESHHSANAAHGMEAGAWPGSVEECNEPGNGDDNHGEYM